MTLQRIALDVPDAGPLHVLVVAEDALFRAGLTALLAAETNYALADIPSDEDDFAAALVRFRPDVVRGGQPETLTVTPGERT